MQSLTAAIRRQAWLSSAPGPRPLVSCALNIRPPPAAKQQRLLLGLHYTSRHLGPMTTPHTIRLYAGCVLSESVLPQPSTYSGVPWAGYGVSAARQGSKACHLVRGDRLFMLPRDSHQN